MARLSSAVAARSAGEEGTDALLATDVSVVAAMSATIAALVAIQVVVFMGISSGSRNRWDFSRREWNVGVPSDSTREIASDGNYSVAARTNVRAKRILQFSVYVAKQIPNLPATWGT
jgi:hypothetical protein